jgi:hypothetical protein
MIPPDRYEILCVLRGNCYEFANRTHERLHAEGLTGFIAHSVEHAFNVGLTDEGVYVTSSDVPGLLASEGTSPQAGNVFGEGAKDFLANPSPEGSAAFFMNMAALKGSITSSGEKAIEKHNEWFTKKWLKASTPGVTIMTREYALDALANYCQFRRGLAVHDVVPKGQAPDYEVIMDALEALRVRTPQHETRPKYNEELRHLKPAVRHLAENAVASSSDLCALVDAYAEVLPDTNTSANVVFGDSYRLIGDMFGRQNAFEHAMRLYERAAKYSRRRNNDLVESKSAKAAAQLMMAAY